MVMPQRFFVTQQSRTGDRHLYAIRTRFIPQALLPLFESGFWPARGAAEAARAAAPRVDIGARLRRMWG
jgi:DNA helicase-2/ATP-dependent DNA helicase PcrA